MIICRVTGNVVGTVKHPAFERRALMIVQPLGNDGKDRGPRLLAVDHAQAGPGDRVLVTQEGNGIRQVLNDPTSPIRALIVGVIDEVQTPEQNGA